MARTKPFHPISVHLTYAGGFSQCGFGDGKGGTHCSSSQAGQGADGVGFTEDVVLGRPIWYPLVI